MTYCTGKNRHVLIITVSYRHVELGLKNEEVVAGRNTLLMALAAMVQLLCLSLVPHMPHIQPVPLVPCVYARDQTQNLIRFSSHQIKAQICSVSSSLGFWKTLPH